MSKIIDFKPRNKPTVVKDTEKPEAYFTNTIQTALDIAAFVYHDTVAVDLLMAELHRFYNEKKAFGTLNPETVKRCSKYLECEDADLDASINFIYGIKE